MRKFLYLFLALSMVVLPFRKKVDRNAMDEDPMEEETLFI